jgi:hypothetical protein
MSKKRAYTLPKAIYPDMNRKQRRQLAAMQAGKLR